MSRLPPFLPARRYADLGLAVLNDLETAGLDDVWLLGRLPSRCAQGERQHAEDQRHADERPEAPILTLESG